MAVKVIIKRHFKEGTTDKASGILNAFRVNAMSQEGYVSGETLVNHYDDRSITVISTWRSVEDWISWQESDERVGREDRLKGLLEEPTAFEIYDVGRQPGK